MRALVNRFVFVDDHLIQFINNEGIMVLLDIGKDELTPIKVVAYCKLDNYKIEKQSQHKHAIIEASSIDPKQVQDRMFNRCQLIKAATELMKYHEKVSNLNDRAAQDQVYKTYSQIYNVEYNQPWDGVTSKFVAETSFTILDWFIIDQLKSNPNFTIDNVDALQQLQLCFNVFPGRKTVLHHLVECTLGNEETQTEILNIQQTAKTLFDVAEKGVPEQITQVKRKKVKKAKPMEIPLFEDINGRTPLDMALNIKRKNLPRLFLRIKASGVDQSIEKYRQNEIVGFIEKKLKIKIAKAKKTSYSMAALIFACIKDYSYLHSGPFLSDVIIASVKMGVPGIGEFI